MNTTRFEATEKAMLAIAAVMIVVGFFSLVSPSDLFVAHRPVRGKAAPNVTVLEHVTVSHSRVYGLCAIIAGAAILTFVLWAAQSTEQNRDEATKKT